jgi:hypothetical protein
MRKYLTIALLIMSCGSEAGGTVTERSPSSAGPVVAVGFDEDEQAEAAAVNDRFRPCAQQSDCATDEQCVRGLSEPFQMCLKACSSVDDCEVPGESLELSETQAVTCRELQGATHCLLSCTSADECPEGMACALNACVWR